MYRIEYAIIFIFKTIFQKNFQQFKSNLSLEKKKRMIFYSFI